MAKRVNYNDRVEDGELDLSMSDLSEVPVRDIALAKKATSLDLSSNRLTSLGKNFTVLTHLTKLDLSKNSISALPSNFGDLILLKHLDLYSNKLNHLPLSFGKLKNLRWLDLKNNPLVPALQDIAGPCLDNQQCQSCAKRVVSVLSETIQRVDEEKKQQEKEEKDREMAEKTAAKKEQQKNKKAKVDTKKKVNENGVKVQEQPQKQQKKKEKPKQKAQPKQSGSFFGRLLKNLVKLTFLVSVGLGLLYWLDVERFRGLQQGASRAVDAAVALLPPHTFVLLNQTSTFLNTDPRVKDYWSNLREIAGLLRDRCADLLATLAVVVPVYVEDAKRFVLSAINSTKT